MTAPRLGTVTIGQAPRPDVTPIIDAYVPQHVTRVHVGVLDGLDEAAIAAAFTPRPRARTLVTRLASGAAVELDADAVEAGLQTRVRDLEEAGCSVIVVLCTGTFRTLRTARAWLIEPDRLLPAIVSKLVGARRLGLVVPLERQIQSERQKWGSLQIPPVFAAASPYASDEAEVGRAARDLRRGGADAIVLDCIGFTARHQRAAFEGAALPVLLSNVLVARVVGGCFPEEPVP